MDKKLSSRNERTVSYLEQMPVVGALMEELASLGNFEGKRALTVSRIMSASKRIPQARELCGNAADKVFFEQTQHGLRRSTKNTQKFISEMYF